MTNLSANTESLPDPDAVKIAVLGLGYVGLPLALEFSKVFPTIGFDVHEERVAMLSKNVDLTREVTSEELAAAKGLHFSARLDDISDCNVYIVAVPTPIDINHQPDLLPLLKVSETIGHVLKRGDVVIYESTVYPGATEEDCIPVLEKLSGLTLNRDFYAGYSPERINPGDKSRPLPMILKVTSGSTPQAARFVDDLYKRIISAGTYCASSIKVAEAAKIIENTQRDLNIALINELSIIFSRLGLDTNEVLDAAATKWNFVRYTPGLVGGHCIGVDPYYLMHRATAAGHIPDLIRIGREINNGMARESANRLVRAMTKAGHQILNARVLIQGVTFKENCPDIRNTKVFELATALQEWGMEVDISDSWADPDEVDHEYGIRLIQAPKGTYDALILAVPHSNTISAGSEPLRALLKQGGLLFDLKAAFPKELSDLRL
ncbi:nucleotide sugar dehydrogenase [Sulfitobacter indolifex]|nr:nucleotide sugar dehydrogenase [Sulfitobacter indolifex]